MVKMVNRHENNVNRRLWCILMQQQSKNARKYIVTRATESTKSSFSALFFVLGTHLNSTNKENTN